MGNKRHGRDDGGQRLAPDKQIHRRAGGGKSPFDIAHGDRRIQAGAEASGGDFADQPACFIGDLRAFPRRSAAFGQDANARNRRRAIERLSRAGKILGFLAALAV